MANTDTKTCECGETFTQAQSSGDVCFKCKISGIRFAFRGATGHGRKHFHDTTMREAVEQSNRDIVAGGGNPKDYAFSGNRWV